MNRVFIFFLFLTAVVSCKQPEAPDAAGVFEATEIMVPAEASGLIKALTVEEGTTLTAGQYVGYIDSLQLFLRKKQLMAQLKATGTRTPDIKSQTGYFQQQSEVAQVRLDHLIREQARTENLVKADAATGKQLDDIKAQVNEASTQLEVISSQDAAQVSALKTQTAALSGERLPVNVQIEQINDQLAKCRIVNPVSGTVLVKYAEPSEMASAGKPLYKVADLSSLVLKAYFTGDQLPLIKLNQQVTVLTDSGQGKFATHSGVIEWISNKAEFTPKTIQTKDERANLVYATKIRVKNNGSLKIGMYGEIRLTP